jgi:hypothetical protein
MVLFLVIFNLQKTPKNKMEMRKTLLKRISFFKWMSRVKTRILLTGRKDLNSSVIRSMLSASEANNFRYSASLVLLALCSILIIEESLPIGYLLPISFFGQRTIGAS